VPLRPLSLLQRGVPPLIRLLVRKRGKISKKRTIKLRDGGIEEEEEEKRENVKP